MSVLVVSRGKLSEVAGKQGSPDCALNPLRRGSPAGEARSGAKHGAAGGEVQPQGQPFSRASAC